MDRLRFAANGADGNSIVGNPQFADPAKGDFTVKNESLARQIGFKNFPMDEFGVRKPSLKAIAERPEMPRVNLKIDTRLVTPEQAAPPVDWMGVKLRHPRGEEMSAYGVAFDAKGLAVEAVERNSPLGGPRGLQRGDMILELNGSRVTSVVELRKVLDSVKDGRLQLRIVREQKETTLDLAVNNLKKPS
jgi:S1-C subfamily serine protease